MELEEEAARDLTVSVLSCVLSQLFSSKTDTISDDPSTITVFHTERAPSISIEDYFQRIAKYSECSAEVLVLGVAHINRILYYQPSFEVNTLTIHRLLLTSIMCSAKFLDDHYCNNLYYAKVGGVSNSELNSLEVEFLALTNFDLFVQSENYFKFLRELCDKQVHHNCTCQHQQLEEAVSRLQQQNTLDQLPASISPSNSSGLSSHAAFGFQENEEDHRMVTYSPTLSDSSNNVVGPSTEFNQQRGVLTGNVADSSSLFGAPASIASFDPEVATSWVNKSESKVVHSPIATMSSTQSYWDTSGDISDVPSNHIHVSNQSSNFSTSLAFCGNGSSSTHDQVHGSLGYFGENSGINIPAHSNSVLPYFGIGSGSPCSFDAQVMMTSRDAQESQQPLSGSF